MNNIKYLKDNETIGIKIWKTIFNVIISSISSDSTKSNLNVILKLQ